jgi:D-alanyl-D-alanine carboxypeptidase
VSYARVRRPAARIAAIAIIALTAVALSVGDADARGKKKKRVVYRPALAHIVLDAKTGKTLETYKADEKRYPASLTKVMTLYLLFERMEAGELKPNSQLSVSRYAALRPPTKLGLKPGDSIRVEDAIKALVTKSANDAAVVVAEAIGGSEAEFARMMTDKARALGMDGTVYANASGLPNPKQFTTARDQALLGRAIQQHFPRQYRYFSTTNFTFRGRKIHTHNKVLEQVKGVDGIKTGYIYASGFNLVTSVRRNLRHVVAVVIGGRTSRSRDAFMRTLIQNYINKASPMRVALPAGAMATGSIGLGDLPLPPPRPESPASADFPFDQAVDANEFAPPPTEMVPASVSAKQ